MTIPPNTHVRVYVSLYDENSNEISRVEIPELGVEFITELRDGVATELMRTQETFSILRRRQLEAQACHV